MIDIKSIWANQLPSDDVIIKTRIEQIVNFKCYAATNHLTGNHLFIIEVSKNAIIPEIKNTKFKGVLIESFDFDNSKELNIYLLDNQLKDVFSLFIENIIEEILKCVTENEVLNETSNVIFKWKKLFDKINFQGLNIEKQKGLIGELLLFDSFLEEPYTIEKLLNSWTGPDYEDKDFLFNDKGIEVKFTSSKTPKIKITSERQLDTQNLSDLFLILFIAEEVKDKGISLNIIIDKIRSRIASNHDALKFFNERLMLVGYFNEDSDSYNREYAVKNIKHYKVIKDFPRITSANLPIGIFNTSYNIELSAIEPFLLESDLFKNILL